MNDLQHISVVIPVYQGEAHLEALVNELSDYFQPTNTLNDRRFIIAEILLVHDCGPDRSDLIIEDLAKKYSQIKIIWLTKNFGQHAATLAGMSSSGGDWIVTMDEDGQHDPRYIGSMIDKVLEHDLQLVYAKPSNNAPHGIIRNILSKLSKKIGIFFMGHSAIEHFHSYRLIKGEISRALAAYCGYGVFLDVALLWIVDRIGTCTVRLRDEGDRKSGYDIKKLLAHFWNMLLTAGTRPLRLITLLGIFSVLLALLIGVFAIYIKLIGESPVQGWASLVVVVSFFSGCILLSLGMIAEYLAVSMGIAMGKPLYVIQSNHRKFR